MDLRPDPRLRGRTGRGAQAVDCPAGAAQAHRGLRQGATIGPPFADRHEAGTQLAAEVAALDLADPVVLGLPRGGVVVAAPVAEALDAPLDVVIVRKLGHPLQPELAVGAIGEGDVEVLNPGIAPHVAGEALDEIRNRERAELARRVQQYRGNRPGIDVAGRAVMLVDDGLATGATARAAIDVLRERGARSITLAVPVGPPDTVRALGQLADHVVCLRTPRGFGGVGQFYVDFRQTTDEEVTALLA
ncbi:MAG: phosphoribosyltransferase family protein [Nitriliruptorales bacterium]|nr:phosphoribosyltransferase family protein [Nitriliruptorales bacterium]